MTIAKRPIAFLCGPRSVAFLLAFTLPAGCSLAATPRPGGRFPLFAFGPIAVSGVSAGATSGDGGPERSSTPPASPTAPSEAHTSPDVVAPPATPTGTATPPPTTSSGGGSAGAAAPTPEPPTPSETPTTLPVKTVPPAPPQPSDCQVCAEGSRTGQVLAAEFPYGALAGVRVQAGAITATSAANGTFFLPAPSLSSDVVTLSAAGRATSVVTGWRDGDLIHHLIGDGSAVVSSGRVFAFGVSGRIVGRDAVGLLQPMAGVLVTAGSPTGAHAPVTTTAVDGTYRLQIAEAPGGIATGATVWGFKSDERGNATRLGALVGLDLQPGQALGDLELQASSGDVSLGRAPYWDFPGQIGWDLIALGPGGVALITGRYAEQDRRAPLFPVPNVTYEVRAWGLGVDGRTASGWRRAVSTGETIAPVLPAPPVPSAVLSLSAGAAWAWRPIPEVDGYRVEVRPASGQAPWEAFSALPRLTLPTGVPAGPARVRIVATAEGGVRSVASLPHLLRLYAPPAVHATWEGEVP